jgi:methyl-accepting chemotaxis protein
METAVDKPMVLFVILDSIFIVLQVCVLAGVFVSLRKLTSSVERIRADVQHQVQPAMADFREVLGEAKHILKNVRGTSENIASISETIKFQVERVNVVIEETTDRARIQIARADEMVADAIQKVEATSAVVQENVLAPIREVSAIIRGVQGGLQFFFTRKRNAVDQVHQDEELFI